MTVAQRIERGELPLLTEVTLPTELEGLREDLLNWDHGHPLTVSQVEEEDHVSSGGN